MQLVISLVLSDIHVDKENVDCEFYSHSRKKNVPVCAQNQSDF